MSLKKAVIRQCVCEYRAQTYAESRRHRDVCEAWKNRPNPRGLSIWRGQKTTQTKKQATKQGTFGSVPTPKQLCGTREFREVLLRHDLNPKEFSAFLHGLQKRKSTR